METTITNINAPLTDIEKLILCNAIRLLLAKDIFYTLDPGRRDRLCEIFQRLADAISDELGSR